MKKGPLDPVIDMQQLSTEQSKNGYVSRGNPFMSIVSGPLGQAPKQAQNPFLDIINKGPLGGMDFTKRGKRRL